ncbi:MAG TPA: hypothetical protein PKD96_02550 [Candidatus Absconditabacterales bacterium]|nr:hypothetical protein [Candidatus Absconditabacterales bacterium]HMT27159.1 hypothetical protein [Candidatus Absconditabacterales bacterium]
MKALYLTGMIITSIILIIVFFQELIDGSVSSVPFLFGALPFVPYYIVTVLLGTTLGVLSTLYIQALVWESRNLSDHMDI